MIVDTKFNKKELGDLSLELQYAIKDKNGNIHKNMYLTDIGDEDFVFLNSKEKVELQDVTHYTIHNQYKHVSVLDEHENVIGYALTKNGSKVFSGNHYGLMDDENFAHSIAHASQYYEDWVENDNIHLNDLVRDTDGNEAIVTRIVTSRSFDDHGCVEIFYLDKRYFEHYTYSHWNEFLSVYEYYD